MTITGGRIGRAIGKAIARRYYDDLTRLNAGRPLVAALMRESTLSTLVALGIGESKTAVAKALRAIPSDKRTAASRANGKRGGRPRTRRRT